MENLKSLENYSLSDTDIHQILGKNVSIVAYPDLIKYKRIEELFTTSNNCIIFFEEDIQNGNLVGHWEAICKKDNTIQFFDSYGLAPDMCRKWLSEQKLIQLKENKPLLGALLNRAEDDGYEILWNQHQYQSYKKDISTCGRHSCCFILNGDLRDDNYLRFMNQLIRKYNAKNYDEAITKFIFEHYRI